MDNPASAFLQALAERMNKENDLSDITYALCRADEKFRAFFFEFCFDEKISVEDINREYAVNNSRPDFYLRDMHGQERIIEVKIYDKNQHFDQYRKDFPDAKYAFIANYPHQEVHGWTIKTWRSFCDAIVKQDLKHNNSLISGYIEYLKTVIGIEEFKAMKLNLCTSLPDFYNNLIYIAKKEFGFWEYNSSKSFCSNYYGQFFYKEDLYLWFGLYLSDGKIYIGLKDADTWVPDCIRKNIETLIANGCDTEYFEQPIKFPDGNYGDYWFLLKDDKFKILCDDKSIEMQKEVLKGFFISVLTNIGAGEYLK